MKILFVNLVYEVGSTGKILAGIVDRLRDLGHEAKILYGVGQTSEDSDALKLSSTFEIRFHNYLSRFTDHAGLYSKMATKRMIREIKSFQPDLIHLHTLHGFYVNYEMLFHYLKAAKIPVVWTLHDCWAFTGHCTHFSQANCMQWKSQCRECSLLYRYPQCYGKGDVKQNYLRKKEAFTGVNPLVITTASHWLAEQLSQSFLKEYPSKVIYNGIDLSVFRPQSSDLRKRYYLENKKIVLGVANAWNARKGLNDMIALAKRLDTTYQIVLVGLTEKQLKVLPQQILGIKRTANQTELSQWYSTADVFINPTYEETFGLTTVEAQACGTPVIVYKTGGCPEAVADGNGVLVSQGDISSLESNIKWMAESGFRADFSKMRVFDEKDISLKYIDLYQQVINHGKLKK